MFSKLKTCSLECVKIHHEFLNISWIKSFLHWIKIFCKYLPPHDNLSCVVCKYTQRKSWDNVRMLTGNWSVHRLLNIKSTLYCNHLNDTTSLFVLWHRAHQELTDVWTNLAWKSSKVEQTKEGTIFVWSVHSKLPWKPKTEESRNPNRRLEKCFLWELKNTSKQRTWELRILEQNWKNWRTWEMIHWENWKKKPTLRELRTTWEPLNPKNRKSWELVHFSQGSLPSEKSSNLKYWSPNSKHLTSSTP